MENIIKVETVGSLISIVFWGGGLGICRKDTLPAKTFLGNFGLCAIRV